MFGVNVINAAIGAVSFLFGMRRQTVFQPPKSKHITTPSRHSCFIPLNVKFKVKVSGWGPLKPQTTFEAHFPNPLIPPAPP